jgi:putative hemolysin
MSVSVIASPGRRLTEDQHAPAAQATARAQVSPHPRLSSRTPTSRRRLIEEGEGGSVQPVGAKRRAECENGRRTLPRPGSTTSTANGIRKVAAPAPSYCSEEGGPAEQTQVVGKQARAAGGAPKARTGASHQLGTGSLMKFNKVKFIQCIL